MADITSSLGTRPIIKYTIAVDADGTREGQISLSSVASFTYTNLSNVDVNNSQELFKFMEVSFQNYDYPLPPLDADVQGNYTLELRKSVKIVDVTYFAFYCCICREWHWR